MPDMSEQQPELPKRQTPFSEAFKAFIVDGWAPYDERLPDRLPAADPAIARRAAVSRAFPGERLVIPAGELKVRSNDTDYRFRPHSAFAHLTGLGTDREPGAVLVLEPIDDDGEPSGGHRATLFFKPRAPRTDREFYADARYGEMWVGQRESLAELAAMCGIDCAPVDELADALAKNAAGTRIRLVRGADEAVEAVVAGIREEAGRTEEASQLDDELTVMLSELRLIKDDFEAESTLR